MFHPKSLLAVCVAVFLVGPLVACEEDGPAERAGRAFDEAADDLRDLASDEGPLEKAGRKADEAIEKTKEAFDD
jgi:hypothetical protein